ncbi:unnamed protein product [Acanthosepion pharaonis]|uniref:EMI domain-containing protein n=1 Tax=Acanthosepion pharaonis TaxID=158019 RepID=A0A812DK68_ACAPH|nr:unnamed protein product [Sepia pharaonis]
MILHSLMDFICIRFSFFHEISPHPALFLFIFLQAVAKYLFKRFLLLLFTLSSPPHNFIFVSGLILASFLSARKTHITCCTAYKYNRPQHFESSTTFGSSQVRRSVCYKYIPQVVTYQQRVLYTELVRTKKCRFLLFCKTAYRTRERYRLERRTKTIQKMQLECCKGYHEVNQICVADEVPTTEQTISEVTNQGTGAWTFRNTSESILTGKNKELRITKSNPSTFIIAIVACFMFVVTVITLVVIVLRRRLKKMTACTSEIPYTPDVMLPPSKSTNEYSVPQQDLNCQNFSPKEENSYISMENGCKLQVPSAKMMLATRGSRYRLDSLEGSRHYSNSLYMTPDPVTYTNQNVQNERILLTLLGIFMLVFLFLYFIFMKSV